MYVVQLRTREHTNKIFIVFEIFETLKIFNSLSNSLLNISVDLFRAENNHIVKILTLQYATFYIN